MKKIVLPIFPWRVQFRLVISPSPSLFCGQLISRPQTVFHPGLSPVATKVINDGCLLLIIRNVTFVQYSIHFSFSVFQVLCRFSS